MPPSRYPAANNSRLITIFEDHAAMDASCGAVHEQSRMRSTCTTNPYRRGPASSILWPIR